MDILFVAGIHGVGKSTCCNKLVSVSDVPCFTASQLIKNAKLDAISTVSKEVADADSNQKLLVAAVDRLRTSHRKIILDGHFTLRTPTGLLPLDSGVFQQIGVTEIVVLSADPHTIRARVLKRDDAEISVEAIHEHQELEVRHAKAIAHTLGVQCRLVGEDEIPDLIEYVKTWGEQLELNAG